MRYQPENAILCRMNASMVLAHTAKRKQVYCGVSYGLPKIEFEA